MLVDVAYVGNKATTCCWSPTTTRRRRTTPPARFRWQSRRPIPTFGDITYVFNGGKSRYDALQMKYEWRMGARRHAAQLADAVAGEGQRRRRAREPERQLPGAAGHQQPRRRLRPVGLPPAVQQHDELRLVAAVRHGQALGRRHVDGAGRARRRLAARRHQHRHAGRDGDVHLHAGGGVPGVGHHARLLAAPTTTGQRHLRSVRRGRPAVDHQLVQHRRASSLPTDPSQPFGNAPRNNVRGPSFWQFDLAASKNVRARRPHASCSSGSRRSTCSTASTSCAPNGNRSAATFGTITATYDARQLQLGVKVLW